MKYKYDLPNLMNDAPYIMARTRPVNSKLILFHWSNRLGRCLHDLQDSRKVFHRIGEGNDLPQAWSQTSNKTLRTRSHNWSPISSFKDGGDRRASFMEIRNNRIHSQVSVSSISEVFITFCTVRKTRWHKTAWRLTVSRPGTKTTILLEYSFSQN